MQARGIGVFGKYSCYVLLIHKCHQLFLMFDIKIEINVKMYITIFVCFAVCFAVNFMVEYCNKKFQIVIKYNFFDVTYIFPLQEFSNKITTMMGNQDSPREEVFTLDRVPSLSSQPASGHQLPPLASRPLMYPRLSAVGTRGSSGGDVVEKASLGVTIGRSKDDLVARTDVVTEVTSDVPVTIGRHI